VAQQLSPAASLVVKNRRRIRYCKVVTTPELPITIRHCSFSFFGFYSFPKLFVAHVHYTGQAALSVSEVTVFLVDELDEKFSSVSPLTGPANACLA
jgi:hypothetical protein